MPPAAKTAQQTGGGALAALSVTGATSQSSDPYEGAMECAVALRTLTTELNSYPALASADQKAALDKAKAIYDQRVAAEGAKRGVSTQEARASVEKDLQLALDDPAPQVRRVAGCLRQLADQGV